MNRRIILVLVFFPFFLTSSFAGEISVAVSSNFMETMKVIKDRFEKKSNHKIKLIFASTGKHFAQIKNGAPFDIFFSADKERAEILEKEKLSVKGSRFTYALGQLALWSPKASSKADLNRLLENKKFRYLALANPKLAPYGRAAKEFLERKKIWNKISSQLVRGENIGQAFQFIMSGNAELGFIAVSQTKNPLYSIKGTFIIIPQNLHSKIEQQVVLLKENSISRQFLDFVKSEEIVALIKSHGYKVP